MLDTVRMITCCRQLIAALNRRGGCRSCSSVASHENVQRTLKVTILGSPNVGKSTFINHLVGRPYLGVSKKVHTTRRKVRAAFTEGNTQVVFLDTPGLVSPAEMRRHHLERSFDCDSVMALKESHMVGVVQDVASPWHRDKLDNKVIRLLNTVPDKPSFLVFNKVDIVKDKRKLLELVKILTKETIRKRDSKEIQVGWPNFSEVFMVSSLTGLGMDSMREYLLNQAREEPWVLPDGVGCDNPDHKLIVELVKAKLLDALPEEVPYNITCEMEYFHMNDLGEIICVVLLLCPFLRHQKMLLSHGGKTVKRIAEAAESDARNALQKHVRLRVVVNSREKKSDEDEKEIMQQKSRQPNPDVALIQKMKRNTTQRGVEYP